MNTERPSEDDRRINPCWRCGHRGPWRIRMYWDHFDATCGHCGATYDIGFHLAGFEAEE